MHVGIEAVQTWWWSKERDAGVFACPEYWKYEQRKYVRILSTKLAKQDPRHQVQLLRERHVKISGGAGRSRVRALSPTYIMNALHGKMYARIVSSKSLGSIELDFSGRSDRIGRSAFAQF